MKGMLRWVLVLALLGVVTVLAFQRYQNEVASLTPLEFSQAATDLPVRVLGRVQAGSLKMSAAEARFALEGQGAVVSVVYRGPDKDTLRELKPSLRRRQTDGRQPERRAGLHRAQLRFYRSGLWRGGPDPAVVRFCGRAPGAAHGRGNQGIMKTNRKWGIVGSVAVVLALAGWLGYTSFQDALVYFYTPSEVLKLGEKFNGKRIRVGGMVENGSMVMTPGTMKIDFRLSDGETVIPSRSRACLRICSRKARARWRRASGTGT
jgi:cytochrome c-type biogenesis protein CcmE